MKAADLQHVVGNKPVGPEILTGNDRREWEDMVRLWADGKLKHLTLAYLHNWASHACGISIGRRQFSDVLKRDAAAYLRGQPNAEQESSKTTHGRNGSGRPSRRKRPAR